MKYAGKMEALPQGLQPLEALGGSLLGLFSRREAHEHHRLRKGHR